MTNNRRYRNKKASMPDNYNPPFQEETLAQSTDILKLNEVTKTLLDGANITTIKDVVKREEKDFYKISTFNKKNLYEVKNALKANKLFLKPTPEVVPQATTEGVIPSANVTAPIKNNVNNNVSNNFNNNNRQNKPLQDNRNDNHPNNRPNNNFNNNNNRQQKDNNVPYVEVTKVIHPPMPVSEVVKEISDIYVKVNKNGKWGFKDREGKQVVAPIYDEVFNFKEDFCCVQKDELFGFVNRQGEEIIPVIYSCATSFSEGYACVYKGEKCGYVNANNETIVDFKFDAGTPVVNGECRIKKDGKWGELHINPPKEDTPDSVIAVALGIENIRWII